MLLLPPTAAIASRSSVQSPLDTVGPIRYPSFSASIDEKGVEAHNLRYNPPQEETAWKAQWIFGESKPLVTLFRKDFHCDSVPRTFLARVSADVRYRLYVNGNLVSRGPADVGRDYDAGSFGPWLYDTREVAQYLHKGDNVIAAQVWSRGLASSESTNGHPGLLFQADYRDGSGFMKSICSDASWRVADDASASFFQIPKGEPAGGAELYQIDAQKEQVGWQSEKFDDSSWAPATLTEPRAAVLPSEIPPQMEAIYPATGFKRVTGGIQVGSKVKIERDGDFTVRFDRVISAYVAMRVKGQSGAVLTVMMNEHDAAGFNRAARLVLRNGWQTFEIPFYDSFSCINVSASHVTQPIEIEDLHAIFTSYPVTYLGSFECSDPYLNRLWQVGRWVTQICMQTHHLDSPDHQEPICDPGDYLIESLVNYQVFGEPWLARQDLRKYGRLLDARKDHNFHTSYALLWLQMLLAYYDYTGDGALVKELAPTVYRLLDTWGTWRGENGLISEAPNYMFMDWVDIAGFNLHHPPAVIGQGYITAFYYRALHDQARVATLLGDDEKVKKCESQRQLIRASFQKELWSDSTGLFRDGHPFQTHVAPGDWLPADKNIETFSPHVNTLAVAYGLADDHAKASVMEKVLGSGTPNCQPYFMHFVFDGLLAGGIYDKVAVAQMHRWKIVEEAQSFHEMWDSGDLSHAWNATPVFQLSTRILGITPSSPGFKTVHIEPHVCGLTHASGSVPTPLGAVEVSWTASGKDFSLSVRVPKGATGDITFPDGTTAHVVGSFKGTSKVGKSS